MSFFKNGRLKGGHPLLLQSLIFLDSVLALFPSFGDRWANGITWTKVTDLAQLLPVFGNDNFTLAAG